MMEILKMIFIDFNINHLIFFIFNYYLYSQLNINLLFIFINYFIESFVFYLDSEFKKI